MATEKDKMQAGDWHDPGDPTLCAERAHAHDLCARLGRARTATARQALVRALLHPQSAPDVVLTPPFFCDYGAHIEIGEGSFFNTQCVLLDTCRIHIGQRVLVGPGVHIYTVTHPMDAQRRRTGIERGQPVTIEDDVWIGGGTVICPGVTIGARTVVGAGSVVTRALPPDVFAAGNPCRVIRSLQGEEGEPPPSALG